MLFNIHLSLDNISFPTIVKDKNLNYIACNRPFVEISGINSEQELIGKSDIHFIWGQQYPTNTYNYYRDDMAVLSNRSITSTIEPVVFYDKTLITRTLKLPIFTHNNKIGGILIMFLEVSEDITGKDINEIMKSYDAISEEKAYFNTITKKVVHDIQSNLSILNILTNKNQQQINNDAFKLINNTVNKLSSTLDILLASQKNLSNTITAADNIRNKAIDHRSQKQEKTTIILSLFIFTILQEKLIEYENLDYKINLQLTINDNIYNTPIFVDELGLSRSISNLINNAIRAVKSAKDKTINIIIEKNNANQISIIIKNNGDRIPQEVLEYINYDASIPSFSIKNQGLGLKQTKEMLQLNEGTIFAKTNKNNEGCIIKLSFPTIIVPNWLTQNIQVTKDSFLIFLHYNEDTLQIFKNKFEKFIKNHNLNAKIAYFKDPSKLIYCIANSNKHIKKNIVLFIETDFTDKQTQLDNLLNYLNIKNINLIASSFQYKKPDIYTNKNIKILPKLFIEDIYLYTDNETLIMTKNKIDIIVIDDDKNFLYAMSNFFFKNKNIETYEDVVPFMNNIDSYISNTIICIDNNLKSSSGVEVAKKLYKHGFKRLFILTGSNKEDIDAPKYITVLNKLHDLHLLKILVN